MWGKWEIFIKWGEKMFKFSFGDVVLVFFVESFKCFYVVGECFLF